MAVYLYLQGGKSMYETLHANLLSSIPSLSRVTVLTRQRTAPMLEGQLRMSELRTHVDEKGYPRYVWMSEDATRITGRVEYDAHTDRCVGFPPPLDPRSGMPNTTGFAASSAEAITGLFEKWKAAQYAYLVLAQPLQKNASAFTVLMFGTDNKFRAQDVLNRWMHMVLKAKQDGMVTLGFSADGGELSLNQVWRDSPALHCGELIWFYSTLQTQGFCL